MRNGFGLPSGAPNPIGYKLSNSEEEIKKALRRAFDLVQKSKVMGLETRGSTNKIQQELLLLFQTIRPLVKPGKEELNRAEDLQYNIQKLTSWESLTIQVLRGYMDQTSQLLQNLKLLNPPLTNAHLKPFMEAMLSDRRMTIDTLGPLNNSIEKVQLLKKKFS